MEELKENEYKIYETGRVRVNNFALGISGIRREFLFYTCTLHPRSYKEDGELDHRVSIVDVKKGDIVDFDNIQVEIIRFSTFGNYVIVKITEN